MQIQRALGGHSAAAWLALKSCRIARSMDFEAIDSVDFLVMASNRYICLNKPFQSLKMPWLCLRTFSVNSSTLNSNRGYSSISKSAFSSASLEQSGPRLL